MARKIRIFLDVLLEAFGEDRLIWSSQLRFSKKFLGDGEKKLEEKVGLNQDRDDGEGEVEDGGYATKEWFEVCREKLADMGVSKELMEKVFRE